MDRGSEAGRSWLILRVGLAVTLTVVFYVVALGVAFLLLGLAWASFQHPGGGSIRIMGFCAIGAAAILWRIFPRAQRFEPPGPRLLPERHPRLFSLLDSVACAAGQDVPAEVYLAPDVNAGVLQAGGLLGFGGRRVMVLGLPLMAALRQSEFRAVIAHEFGHFHGGETGFGPWIHRTQAAIGRTIRSLEEAGSWLHFLFLLYGKAFLLITLAVSRRQELAADRLAAGIVGAGATADGLRATHGASRAFAAFLAQEMGPVLSAGFRAPLAEGFRSFLGAREVAGSVRRIVEEEARGAKGDPYDSHPPLGERLRALGDPSPLPPSREDPPASAVLDDLAGLEEALFRPGPGRGTRLSRLPWEEVGARVYIPAWRREVEKDRVLLEGWVPERVPELVARPAGDPRWRRRGASAPPEGNGPPRAAVLAAASIALHLVARGWKLDARPGRPIILTSGEEAVLPFQEIEDLAAGTTSSRGWAERCRVLGIAGLPLDAPPGGGGDAT